MYVIRMTRCCDWIPSSMSGFRLKMSPGAVFVLCWILVIGVDIPRAGAFYHLASPTHPCRVMAPENGTVDMICQFREDSLTLGPGPGSSFPCHAQGVVWQRSDLDTVVNISDSSKYGVWTTIQGWGIEPGDRISLLRIRSLQAEDAGRYQCRVHCRGRDGRPRIEFHRADVCMQQPNSNYAVCGAPLPNTRCMWSFANGVCDPECDNEESLYDGFDCAAEQGACDRTLDAECRNIFANGVCDSECDSPGCVWDGGDCVDKPLQFADDTIVLTLARWYQMAGKTVDVKDLGRALSKLLRTLVRVLPDDWQGHHMQTEAPSSGKDRDVERVWHRPDKRGYHAIRRIYLKLDNTVCYRRCFEESENAARYIALAIRNGWDPSIPISAIGVLGPSTNRCLLENNTLLRIDLPISSEGGNPNIYSYTYAESDGGGDEGPPLWVVVVAIVGGVFILVLGVVIVVIVTRIRKLSKQERHAAALERIHDKNTPQGTDV